MTLNVCLPSLDACRRVVERLRGIDDLKIETQTAQRLNHFKALVGSHKPVVHVQGHNLIAAECLDHERGGSVAPALADLYEWARLQLVASNKDKAIERLQAVRLAMTEISEAWSSIANKVA